MKPIISAASNQILSEKQRLAIKFFEDGGNVFVSGGAGCGKSFLINFLKQNYTKFGLEVVATTGIAAVNIGGATIHSWSGIGLGNMPIEQILENIFSAKFAKIRKRIQQTKSLAIDEISMLSAQTLELLDEVFRNVRQSKKPMGGLQILLFGDFLQLPPISQNGNEVDFCFNSSVWRDLEMKNVVMDEVFRQTDVDFIKILQNLRFGRIDEKAKKLLNERVVAQDQNSAIRPTILTTHNLKVEQINHEYLKKIPSQEVTFEANYSGTPAKIEFLKKNCLAYEKLRLKVGAQVMMIKNTFQKEGIINGSLGIVRDFSPKKSFPIVEFVGGKVITIAPEDWLLEKFDHETKSVILEAGMSQIPLILAWAMTIHKSQGLTLDKISCDLSDVFSCGQAYVALSRARSLDGIFIRSINFNKITANQQAVDFYQKFFDDGFTT